VVLRVVVCGVVLVVCLCVWPVFFVHGTIQGLATFSGHMSNLTLSTAMHARYAPFVSTGWPLHDIVSTNIVWCISYTREVGRGVAFCPIIVQ